MTTLAILINIIDYQLISLQTEASRAGSSEGDEVQAAVLPTSISYLTRGNYNSLLPQLKLSKKIELTYSEWNSFAHSFDQVILDMLLN